MNREKLFKISNEIKMIKKERDLYRTSEEKKRKEEFYLL